MGKDEVDNHQHEPDAKQTSKGGHDPVFLTGFWLRD